MLVCLIHHMNKFSIALLILDRGNVKGNVFLDGKEIVDISIDNSNGIDIEKNKKITNNLNQTYYNEILSKEFVDILATNNNYN